MYTASNNTVSTDTSYSNDLVSQHPATSDLSSGNMAGMGSYSDGQRTVFDPLTINPQAASTPANIRSQSVHWGPITNLSQGSEISFLSSGPNSDLESEHSHVSLQPFPIFAQTSEIQSVNDQSNGLISISNPESNITSQSVSSDNQVNFPTDMLQSQQSMTQLYNTSQSHGVTDSGIYTPKSTFTSPAPSLPLQPQSNSLIQIESQLQQQLTEIQNGLQRLAFLQRQQQRLAQFTPDISSQDVGFGQTSVSNNLLAASVPYSFANPKHDGQMSNPPGEMHSNSLHGEKLIQRPSYTKEFNRVPQSAKTQPPLVPAIKPHETGYSQTNIKEPYSTSNNLPQAQNWNQVRIQSTQASSVQPMATPSYPSFQPATLPQPTYAQNYRQLYANQSMVQQPATVNSAILNPPVVPLTPSNLVKPLPTINLGSSQGGSVSQSALPELALSTLPHSTIPELAATTLPTSSIQGNIPPAHMPSKKEIYPDNFDGSSKTEWTDYIVHFEQVASWNQWSEVQKAQMLSIHLRGEAQRLLGDLTIAQLSNYQVMKQIISERYEPKEKDVAYRCQFRYRKREKGESVSDYGYQLNRLARKAYPNLTLSQLEMHVIDQFITGIGNYDLQKHVQFGHPKSMNAAIGLATEYEALDGSVDRIKKPHAEPEHIAPIVSNVKNVQPSITLDQIDKLLDKKLNSLSAEGRIRTNSPSPTRYPNHKTTREPKDTTTGQTKSEYKSPVKFCNYCKKQNHTIEECRKRKYKERQAAEKQVTSPKDDAAYVITSQSPTLTIPDIVITPALDSNTTQNVLSMDKMVSITNQAEINTEDISKHLFNPVITSQIYDDNNEIKADIAAASCLYIDTEILQTHVKLLVDTGSPYSILSQKHFEKLQHDHDIKLSSQSIKLTAADGSQLEISGKATLEFYAKGICYEQDFIIAKIQGIVGILGMDFLTKYDGSIKVNKQTLKTSKGTLKLNKQQSIACARILVKDDIVIKANTEQLIPAKIDQPCLRKEQVCFAEPVKYLTSKGCFLARTIVNPENENVIVSVVNLSDQAIKINQQSVLGKLDEVDTVFSGDTHFKETSKDEKVLPKHLQMLLESASPKLTPAEKEKMKCLLVQHQDIFMSPDGILGQTDLVEHKIETENHKPIKIPPRRIPIYKRGQVDEELDKMLNQGTVEPSYSPWSAPICLVKKKDGSCRFCIDYRKLNAITVKDAYPLPRIDDTLDLLSESRWFSTLDLASGSWQIKMSETDKKKTAFVTPHRGLYHFNVMPFGLTNAPATFQRLMEKVLFGLSPQRCLCYLDDIIVLGKTFDEALENLELIFQRLKEANLKLKPKKCFLFQSKVTYLGHIVSDEGITCDPSKVDSIIHWPTPTNKSEVRSILGLLGYYRKFIPEFAAKASPLTKLTRKNAKFSWTTECQQAFQELKDCLTRSPILALPKQKGMFVLDTDASMLGLGGVLSQIQDGDEKVIAYASRKLNPAQQQYCTTKRELLAVVTFMKHFKHYLLGQEFLIRTDHAPLVWLRNFKEPEGLIA